MKNLQTCKRTGLLSQNLGPTRHPEPEARQVCARTCRYGLGVLYGLKLRVGGLYTLYVEHDIRFMNCYLYVQLLSDINFQEYRTCLRSCEISPRERTAASTCVGGGVYISRASIGLAYTMQVYLEKGHVRVILGQLSATCRDAGANHIGPHSVTFNLRMFAIYCFTSYRPEYAHNIQIVSGWEQHLTKTILFRFP